MRNAFTLIELMIVISIIAIIAAIAIPNIMEKRPVIPGPTPEPKISIQIGNNTYQAQKFTMEGHSYFWIKHSEYHGFTAVHNPECPKCKPAPVKELEASVEVDRK